MSSQSFRVVEHVIPCQHIREYPNATRDQHPRVLKLAIKQYIPLYEHEPGKDAVTLIMGHANGFSKECYEPLWDDMERFLRSHGVTIRGIWAADCSQQGASGVLNEYTQGDDTSWFDHSRDLLVMVNHFADQMPRPIVGVAHSMGCAQLINLSVFHPRLFSALILIEPVITKTHPSNVNSAYMSTFRKDLWPSREAAEASFRRNKFFQAWDRRVFDKFLQFGLRQVPTAIYPYPNADKSVRNESVTLTTTKHQESWSYVRPNFEPQDENLDHLLSPDLDPKFEGQQLSQRAESVITLENLQHLRPNVLYLFGGKSPLSTEAEQMEKLVKTGVGIGGNGGSRRGKVQRAVISEAGHLLPFETTAQCSTIAAEWLVAYLEEYRRTEDFLKAYGSKKSDAGMRVASKEWNELVRKSPWTLRPLRGKL